MSDPEASQQKQSSRFVPAAIALTGAGALALQPTLGEAGLLENALGMLRFFTIWSNIAAVVIMALVASGRHVAPGVLAALATALTVVGSVYWLLLSGDHHPVGLDRLTNQVFHTIAPAAILVWWLLATPAPPAIRPLIPAIMVPPLSYGLFAFIYGEISGFYAYFFLDLPAMGWPAFIASNIVLAMFFGLVGAGLLALKRVLARGRSA